VPGPPFLAAVARSGDLECKVPLRLGGRLVALEIPRDTLPVVSLRRRLIEQRVAFRAASSVMVDTDADWLGRGCRV